MSTVEPSNESHLAMRKAANADEVFGFNAGDVIVIDPLTSGVTGLNVTDEQLAQLFPDATDPVASGRS